MKRVLVQGDDGELLGYASIDPTNEVARGNTRSGTFALYMTNNGSYIVTRDGRRYSQYTRDEVVDLLLEAGQVDLLIDRGMIREL